MNININKSLYTAEYRAMTPESRWHFRADKSSTCWIWSGQPAGSGYGCLEINGKNYYAHRFGYELLRGPIAEGMVIDHLCRNKICVNPWHLEVVTQRENILRGDTLPAENLAKTHCLRGHPLSGGNLRRYRGWRRCRACQRLASAIFYLKKKRKLHAAIECNTLPLMETRHE